MLLFAALLCCGYRSYAQSNKGTEFWTAYMDHVNGAGGNNGSQMSLYLVSTVNTSGTVSVNDNSFAPITFNLVANQPQEIAIPEEAFLGESNNDAPINKGIHIVSAQPIAAYAHIYRSSVSGATLLLPVNSLGKEYYSINYTQVSNSLVTGNDNKKSYSLFNIVATEDNTTIEITPKATLLSGQQANSTFTIQLNKGQVYQGLSNTDLTGTLIKSIASGSQLCKKIAVFSGSSKIGIGCNGNPSTGIINATSDNLFQQVYPTVTWGKNYYAVPLKSRNYDIFRVVYSDVTAQVKVNGSSVTPSNGYYEFTSQEPVVVTSDKPVQLVQYTVSQGEGLGCPTRPVSGDTGDPEMIFLPPVEQGLKQVTLFSTSRSGISPNLQFINVILPVSAVSSFKLDGNSYPGFVAMPQDPNYVYAQINVSPGSHNISAAKPFTAIAYGFGLRESYGYAAGTNLQNLNEYLDLKENFSSSASLSNGCANTNYLVQLVVPNSSLPFIQWKSSDGAVIPTDNNPQVVGTRLSDNGITTLYVYQLQGQINKPAGYYNITASIPNQGANNDCGPLHDISFDFNISDFPEANFTTQTGTCVNSPIAFTDASDAKGSTLVNWEWNFGDAYSTTENPNTSTDQNPVHTFTKRGIYEVSLSVINQNGCPSQVVRKKKVYINSIPVVHIQSSVPNCAAQSIDFFDRSTSIDGKVTERLWTFEDPNATTADRTSVLENPTHTYSRPGTYKVKLQVKTDSSCVSAADSIMITVNPLPKADFTLPDVCLDNATAVFINKSSPANSGLTYLWDFGDPLSSAADNTSTEVNGRHVYHQLRDASNPYKVKLTVKTANGCVKDTTLNLIVNGSNPKPEFGLDAANTFCSKDSVIFIDKSAPDFGVITRLRWYYDVENKPNEYEEFLYRNGTIHSNKKYKHFYEVSHSFTPRIFKVRLEVSSGEGCDYSTGITTVTVYPNPLVTLGNIPPEICQEKPAVQISQNTNGFTGAPGVFTGDGITAGGLFNPKNAGPGLHTIKYLFKADGSQCPDEQTFTIFVNPTPIVSGKRNLTIAVGERVTLEPLGLSLNGTNLTYQWTPATGLNRTNVASPVASPASDTEYKLTVTSDNQCETVALFNVTVIQQPVTYNTFTPNGDGRNDTWEIPNMDDHPKAVVEVFNRNGQRVFYSIGYPIAWDGRYNGADLPAATYYYVIDLKDGKKPLSGPLTIVR